MPYSCRIRPKEDIRQKKLTLGSSSALTLKLLST